MMSNGKCSFFGKYFYWAAAAFGIFFNLLKKKRANWLSLIFNTSPRFIPQMNADCPADFSRMIAKVFRSCDYLRFFSAFICGKEKQYPLSAKGSDNFFFIGKSLMI